MGGNGPLMNLMALTEYLAPKRPKVVLWFFFAGNDLSDLLLESKSALLTRYLEDGFNQGLLGRQTEIDDAIRTYLDRNMRRMKDTVDARTFNPLDVLMLRNLRGRLAGLLQTGSAENAYTRQNLALFQQVLLTAKARTEGWGGKFVLVFLPDLLAMLPNGRQDERTETQKMILETIRGLGVTIINPTKDLAAAPGFESRLTMGIGHYNEDGYRVIAEKVLHYLDSMPLDGQ